MRKLAAAPDRPLHDHEGSLTLAPGWPPASPQPATENPYGNTRERLTNRIAPAVKCQDSRSSKTGIGRQVRRNPHHAVRRELSAPVLAELETWMRAERAKLSRHAPVGKAMDYMLRRWDRFARFLDDGRICLSNNAAERALRGTALGRKSWLFAGSDRGGRHAAAMYTLIGTAKLNDVDPQAWLADVLGRIAETPQSQLDELLPWNWVPEQKFDQAA